MKLYVQLIQIYIQRTQICISQGWINRKSIKRGSLLHCPENFKYLLNHTRVTLI